MVMPDRLRDYGAPNGRQGVNSWLIWPTNVPYYFSWSSVFPEVKSLWLALYLYPEYYIMSSSSLSVESIPHRKRHPEMVPRCTIPSWKEQQIPIFVFLWTGARRSPANRSSSSKSSRVTVRERSGATRTASSPYRNIFTLFEFAGEICRAFQFGFDHMFGFYDILKNFYESIEGFDLFSDEPKTM